ncbi:hypothetical protein [Candidatus Methylopumilus turicensis]|uniref:Methyltransferase type 11 domain-containing protein n=1 Tax=Candidatus Methylopumilus turicensis TaxID=1581680 RepID=A0A0B7J025_9PROT|nr:hypothetical protein [Candidatus Methylopumilus turicensis]CEN56680.1 protein of unknown function [Candidatus Methylopumilus turicensis]
MSSQNKFTTWKDRFQNTQNDYFQIGFECPEVRRAEFFNLREMDKKEFKKILEFPADGMMLNDLYPEAHIDRAELMEADFSAYQKHPIITDFFFNKIERNGYDAIMSITPIHHASDDEQRNYLSAAYECLSANGLLVVGEVFSGSKVAKFLDQFVNEFSINGHRGNYPNLSFKDEFEAAGFHDVEAKVMSCPWVFQDEDQMMIFVTKLLGLKAISRDFLLCNLKKWLGVFEDDNKFYLDWELMYFKGVK